MSYVGKGTPPGVDVNTAIDYLQLFNSSWPLIKIEHTGTATINLNSSSQDIYTHNLGYPPLYFLTGLMGGSLPGVFNSGAGLNGIGVNSTKLFYSGAYPAGGTYSFRYYVCRVDLTKTIKYDDLSGDTSSGSIDNDYGIKVTVSGKDISSTDLRDYSVHSDSRSIMVGAQASGATSPTGTGYFTYRYVHGQSYTPTALGFARLGPNSVSLDANSYYLLPPAIGVSAGFYDVNESSAGVTIDGYYISSGTPDASIVVLKDPFDKPIINRTFP